MKALASSVLSQNVTANLLQAYVLVGFMILFVGLTWRTYKKRQGKTYDKIAAYLLKDEKQDSALK